MEPPRLAGKPFSKQCSRRASPSLAPGRCERNVNARCIRMDTNALASSIVLVCRKRAADAATISRREFLRELNAVLPEALDEMTKGSGDDRSPVAPVDLSQAIIGPGMAVFSKYAAVLEADGSPMSVRTALQLINRFLAEDDFDADTQFCLHWFEQHGWSEGRFGDADTLARAKGTSVDGMSDAGVVESGGGIVRLRKWSEYPADWDPQTDTRNPVWETLHHLIRALKQEGETGAGRLLAAVKGKAEAARQLAYRLYTLCERQGWAEDARAYNELITSWTGIESAAGASTNRRTRQPLCVICMQLEYEPMKPWREVAVPHPDVLEGTFQQSEFAADITAVRTGKATPEYQDAAAFFQRTFITEGMRLLLIQVAQRLNGQGGEPVIQLQTAFGGGKTHTMLAVYHLATRSARWSDLAGIPALDRAGRADGRAAGARRRARRHRPRPRPAVEARQAEHQHALGRTGLAARRRRGLRAGAGGRRHRHLAGQRRARDAPGSLRAVRGADGRAGRLHPAVPGGPGAERRQLTTATCRSSRRSPRRASWCPTPCSSARLPESEVEAGSQRGVAALRALEKTFGRVQALWKPVATEEAFEIVRRRLFEPMRDEKARDAVCRAFADAYVAEGAKLPAKRRRRATTTGSCRRTRSTRRSSTGSTRTGRRSTASSAPAACSS